MNAQLVPLRQRRDLGQIIEAALHLYAQNLGPFLRIGAVVIPLDIAAAVVQSRADTSLGADLLSTLMNALALAVNFLVSAALVTAVGEIDAGRMPRFSQAYDVAFARYWTLIGALLRAVFHVFLFAITIIGIPWAIQRLVRWLFVEQAVIFDGANAREALNQSGKAVIGRWWPTVGISVVIWIVAALPAPISWALFYLAPVLFSATVSAILHTVALPFSATAMTLLYFDLQSRKEPDELARAA